MRHASDHLIAPDGLRLSTRAWIPRSESVAAVVLVHGYAEHVGRHERLATELARAGYAVHGYDQRGHGYSPGPRANVRRLDQLLADLAAFVAEVRSWHPSDPIVVLGHSMGGLLAVRAVQERLIAPRLLILSSPLLRIVASARLPRALRRAIMALAEPLPGLPTLAVDPRHISRDPLEVDAYRNDPAIYHGPGKGRISAEMVRHGERALAAADLLDLPVLVLHGRDDAVADPAASGQLVREAPNATIRLYDEGPHEIFHDAHRERATADVLAWLQARLSPDESPAAA